MQERDKIDVIVANLCDIGKYELGEELIKIYDNLIKENMEINKVYEFCYTDCIHEGAPITISLHRTKKGAEMAMEHHKNEKYREWEEYKKCKEEDGDEYVHEFGKNEYWGVNEREILN
jgi:hypothetical protein